MQPILSFTLCIGDFTVPLRVGSGQEQKMVTQFQSNTPKFHSFQYENNADNSKKDEC